MISNIRITGAGAGTGKTYRLCAIITEALKSKNCRPGAFIATTFTKKAATELNERVRARLLKDGLHDAALRVEESLVGTVHSVCSRILERFAFDAGISPRLRVLDETLERILLSEAIEECFDLDAISEMEVLSHRLGQYDSQTSESKWRDQVRGVISAARSNAIDANLLAEMAHQNVQEIFGFLPPVAVNDLESALHGSITDALARIPLNGDKTKTTAQCVQTLEQALSELKTGNLAWPAWCKLSKLSAAKASLGDVLPVNQAAAGFEQHPHLRQDIECYIEHIFSLAAEAMESFQARKKARGMLDFTDLEVLTLGLLQHAHVQACIREEYDLLVVDEFQDTSPIQLELFVRLADLVKEAHWVGDTKQAIYGFRGCDPELMRAAERKFRAGGSEDTLRESRRHRPELVDFFNGLFPGIFAKNNSIQRDQVELKAHRKPNTGLPPAIELWALSSGRTNKDGSPSAIRSAEVDDCIVRGILEMKSSGMMVSDKERQTDDQDSLRPLCWRDIAVLCRSNNKASAIAAKLLASGVPAARKTQGLLSTPEAVLTLACLRWLNDENDSVATAEILSLEACREIEDWLEDRIAWIRDGRTGCWGVDGGLFSPVLARIASLQERMKLLTPAELLDATLIQGDIAGIASQWGAERSSNRRSNLEALRGLATKYESECLSGGTAASHAGFLIWCGLIASAEQDNSAFDESADAVQVMTWHGSKGLEWPVVICLDLESEPRPRIWNSSIVFSESNFDPDKPLFGRRIRFWPYPFGQQTSDVPLNTTVESSPIGAQAALDAEFEQSRLHYVVMTRARDVLVFPQDGRNSPWLSTGIQCAALELPAGNLTEDTVDSINRRIRYLTPADNGIAAPTTTSVKWFAPPVAPEVFPPAELSPSGLPPVAGAKTADVISYGKRLNIASNIVDQAIGNALHAIQAACFIDPGMQDTNARAERILAAHNVNADAAEVASSATEFHAFLLAKFKPKQILVEVPFTHWNAAGQCITGFMDLVLITEEGAVLIDHKTYQGANLDERTMNYSGQLAAYRDALTAHGHTVHSAWIHYCTQGKLVHMSEA